MRRATNQASGWMLILAALAGTGLLALPPASANLLRGAARDVVRPGQTLVAEVLELVRSWRPSSKGLDQPAGDVIELTARIRELEAANRRLIAEKAALDDEYQRATAFSPALPPIEQGTSLLQGTLVAARVLAGEGNALWRGRNSLSVGSGDGIQELATVLEASQPLLDQGNNASLAADQPVYAGRTVVGRVGIVGRYSSTLVLVTDAEYRGRARLARETPRGIVFGVEGTLKGDGTELCRLDLLPATEPVSVGDPVYTGIADSTHPVPMYYGTVVRAELPPGALQWSIWVKPAADLEQLRTLHVLRTQINPERVLGN